MPHAHWKDWCWSWDSNSLATWCEELMHLKRPCCWERLKAGGEGEDKKKWDGWMASLPPWTWVWVNSGSWWWTGRPGVLRFMGSQRVGHNWATELDWTNSTFKNLYTHIQAPLVAQIVKNLPALRETWVQSLGREKSPGEENGNLLQYCCLENPMNRGARRATVHGVSDFDMTERLTHMLTHLTHYLGLTLSIQPGLPCITIIHIKS